jgi:MoaA/NifB/PqqE/SkfB family radical SAM enzyme
MKRKHMDFNLSYDLVRDAFQRKRFQWKGTIIRDGCGREFSLSPSGAAALGSILNGDSPSVGNIEQSALVQLLVFYFLDRGSLSGVIDYASLLRNGPGLMQPTKVSFEITTACNLNCMHCYNDSGKGNVAGLDEDQKMAIVDYLGRWGVRYLHLTGGEPVNDPSLPGLLSLANHYGIGVLLTTNGWTLSDPVLAAIEEGTVIQVNISLDGANAATHDAFRGKRSSYARVLYSIRLLGNYRPRTLQLNASVHATSVNQMEALTNLALENGFDIISFKPITFSGRSDDRRDFLLSLTDLRFFRKERARLNTLYRDRLHVEGAILDHEVPESVQDRTGCDAAERSMVILADGKMTPCAALKTEADAPGMRSLSPMHAWLTDPLFVNFRSIKDGLCRSNPGCPGGRFTNASGTGRGFMWGVCHA